METAVVTSLIAGMFSLATALGSVWLKQYLENRSSTLSPTSPPLPLPQNEAGERRQSVSLVLLRAVSIIAFGFSLGAISRFIRYQIPGRIHYEAIVSLVILVGFSLILALARRRPSGRVWQYQLELFSLWAAHLAGWSIVNQSIWTDIVGVLGIWWFGCALIGGIVAALRNRSGA